MPTLLMAFGPVRGALPALPSDEAINWAILLNVVAYVAFLAGLARGGAVGWQSAWGGPRTHFAVPSMAVIGIFCLLGIAGLAFRFQTLENLTNYFLGSANLSQLLADRSISGASLAEAAGTFLSSALGFAFVLLWCRRIDASNSDKGRIGLRRTIALVVIGCAVALSYSVYLYNRGAVVVPLIALAAAFSVRKRRLSFSVLTLAGLVLISATFEFGNLRATYFNPQAVGLDYNQQLQIYGSAPQFTAFMLEQNGNGGTLYLGQTLMSSLVYPIPVIGRDHRATSGVAIYNRLIYGIAGPTDQIVPFQGELFWNFGIPGVVLGFFGLGLIVARLQIRFEYAASALQAYIIQYVSVWLGFLVIGALAVVSQIVIYFMWPFLAIGILHLLGLRRSRRGVRPGSVRVARSL